MSDENLRTIKSVNSMSQLLRLTLDKFNYDITKQWISSKITTPESITLKWEYGNHEPFQAWIIADMGERNVVAVFCNEGGYGKLGSPWGIIFRNNTDFGMDFGWYPDFESLILDGWVESETDDQ